jgi:hypothetical protein
METLAPIQRIAVIAIGLVLTAIAALVVLPWASSQIEARLPPTGTPLPPTATRPPIPIKSPSPPPTQGVQSTLPPAAILLESMPYVQQTVGNNGPASLEIVLSYWGYTDTQDIIRGVVQPGELDTTVEPEELAEYIRSRQLATYVGVNGGREVLAQLLANEFPVIVSRWIPVQEGAESIQYQVIRGYNREAESFTLYDSALGPVEVSYAELDDGWRVTNRQYLVVFPPQRAERLRTLIDWDENGMWESALAQAKDKAAQDAEDPYAWLNQANALSALDRCEEALQAFARAQEVGLPVTLVGHQLRVLQCMIALEEYDRLLVVTKEAIAAGLAQEWLHLYRAQAYAAQDDPGQARAQYQLALEIHPGWAPAQEGLANLSE